MHGIRLAVKPLTWENDAKVPPTAAAGVL